MEQKQDVTLEGKTLTEVQQEKVVKAAQISDETNKKESKPLIEDHYKELAETIKSMKNLRDQYDKLNTDLNAYARALVPVYFPGEKDADIDMVARVIRKK